MIYLIEDRFSHSNDLWCVINASTSGKAKYYAYKYFSEVLYPDGCFGDFLSWVSCKVLCKSKALTEDKAKVIFSCEGADCCDDKEYLEKVGLAQHIKVVDGEDGCFNFVFKCNHIDE